MARTPLTEWRLDPKARWALAVAWMGLIFFLSAQSRLPDLGPGIREWQDVAGHLFVYGVLGLLWQSALRASEVRCPSCWAFVVVVLFGLSDEFHQAFVPGRQPTLFDVATDAVGAAIALGLQWWVRRRPATPARPKPPTPTDGRRSRL